MINKKHIRNEKYSFLQLVLTVISVSCLLVSNIITSRQVQLLGLTLTGGAFVFPVTYILSDVFSEVYGYRWSRITCYIGFAMNTFMACIFQLVINAPAPSYFENTAAFITVLSSAPRVLVASLAAFVIGDFANDVVFQKMKDRHKNEIKGFGWRAIISSLVGEIADSLVFYPLAFWGQMSASTLLQMMVVGVITKTAYEVIILPVTTLVVKAVSRYEQGT